MHCKSRSTSKHPSAVSKTRSFAGEGPNNVFRNAMPCPFRPSALLRFSQSKTEYPDFLLPLFTDDDDSDLLFPAPQGEKSSPLPPATVSQAIQPQPQVTKETAKPLPSSSTPEAGMIKESETLDLVRVASRSGLPYCFVDNKFGRAEDALKAAMARMAQPHSSPVSCCCCFFQVCHQLIPPKAVKEANPEPSQVFAPLEDVNLPDCTTYVFFILLYGVLSNIFILYPATSPTP